MHAEVTQPPGWGEGRDAFRTKIDPVLANIGEPGIGGQKRISKKPPMQIDDQVRQRMAVRKVFLMRHVGAEPAPGEPGLRIETHVALGAQNLPGPEYVSLRDQQIDVTGI